MTTETLLYPPFYPPAYPVAERPTGSARVLYPPFYPPAFPAAPQPPHVPERLYVNDLALNDTWVEVEGLESLLVAPARRGENVTVPGRHGAIRTPRKHYDPAEIVLPLWVKGVRRHSGEVPLRAASALYDNVDLLLRTFHTETVTLRYVRDDGTARVATAEIADEPVVAVRHRSAPPLARVSVALSLIDAFWTEATSVSQTLTGPTGTVTPLTVFAGSTAPIADARITFFGPVSNPKLTIGSRWVQFNGVIGSGRELVLDCGHWDASSGAGAVWSPDERQVYREPGPAWLEIPPSADPTPVTFTHTGGNVARVEIAGKRRFLTP